MVNGLLAEGGLVRRELTPAEIREVEPALHGDFVGGFLTESDSSGDIHKFTIGPRAGLRPARRACASAPRSTAVAAVDGGVRIAPGGREEAFDGVVVSAGIRSRAIAQALGDRVNIYPVKGYSITVALNDAESQAAAPWVSLLDDRAKIVASRFGADRFRIAGTAEFNGANKDIRADRIRPLTEWCEKHFPGISTEQVTPWAGLRPMTPSMLPRVGRGKRPGVFYNTGHGHLGWTLSAATARLVATRSPRALAPRPRFVPTLVAAA